MRHVTQNGLNLIKEFEGLSLTEYKDVVGYRTIGYGHLLRASEGYPRGITEEDAENILKKDLGNAEWAIGQFITVPLNDNQFDALASFTFNLGGESLRSSTLRKKLNSGDYPGAADEFKKWVNAGGVPVEGLKKRREKERELFLKEEV